MSERRATNPSAKEARGQQMLVAAAELLERWSYSDITMDRIARRAGVAKGTLYLYFRTKEALFLSLYEERLGAWYTELQALADYGAGTVEPAAAARAIASTLAARPILIHLHGLLHSTLGHNVDFRTTAAFRRDPSCRTLLEAHSLLACIHKQATLSAWPATVYHGACLQGRTVYHGRLKWFSIASSKDGSSSASRRLHLRAAPLPRAR